MNHEEKIDQYLLGNLVGSELESFKLLLVNDPELKKELAMLQAINKGIKYNGSRELKQRLKLFRKNMLSEETVSEINSSSDKESGIAKTPNKFWKIIAIVFCLGVLGFLATKFNDSTKENLETNLFAAHYQPFEISLGTRDSMEEKLAFVDALYANANYLEAIPHLNSLLANGAENSNLNLALGNCYLVTNQFEKAESTLIKIANDGNDLYSDQAKWYLALNYLKQNKVNQTTEILNALIQDPRADFHREATNLLNQLSK